LSKKQKEIFRQKLQQFWQLDNEGVTNLTERELEKRWRERERERDKQRERERIKERDLQFKRLKERVTIQERGKSECLLYVSFVICQSLLIITSIKLQHRRLLQQQQQPRQLNGGVEQQHRQPCSSRARITKKLRKKLNQKNDFEKPKN